MPFFHDRICAKYLVFIESPECHCHKGKYWYHRGTGGGQLKALFNSTKKLHLFVEPTSPHIVCQGRSGTSSSQPTFIFGYFG